MAETRRIESYREFWPYYLREHQRAATRRLHLAGTAIATVALFALFVSASPWLLLVAVVGGYAPAWLAHALFEHNRPATFRYPLWSLMADYRMAWSWVCGQLDSELAEAGITER